MKWKRKNKSKLGTGKDEVGLSWPRGDSGFQLERTFESFMCAD
jgi:hypothetical protein